MMSLSEMHNMVTREVGFITVYIKVPQLNQILHYAWI